MNAVKEGLYNFLLHFHGPAGYVGVLFVLICCGLGLPLPEDVALITGGILAGYGLPRGVGSVWAMVFVGLAGILIGDSVIFRAGQTLGEKFLQTPVGRHIPSERIERTIKLFERHGAKFIMVARFLPGVRAVTYFVAGSTGVPFWKFLLFDGIAACASAPGWVFLGYWAGKHHMLTRAWRLATNVQMGILIAAGALLLWIVVLLTMRARGNKRKAAIAALPAAKRLESIEGGRGVSRTGSERA